MECYFSSAEGGTLGSGKCGGMGIIQAHIIFYILFGISLIFFSNIVL